MVQIVTLTSTLTDTSKDRVTSVSLGNVVLPESARDGNEATT